MSEFKDVTIIKKANIYISNIFLIDKIFQIGIIFIPCNLNLTPQNQNRAKRSMGLILLKPKRFGRIPTYWRSRQEQRMNRGFWLLER